MNVLLARLAHQLWWSKGAVVTAMFDYKKTKQKDDLRG